MKRIAFLLVLFAVTSPAFSAVNFSFETPYHTDIDEEDANLGYVEGILLYDANGEGTIRAFALQIVLSDPNFGIDSIWRESDDYWVSPINYDGDDVIAYDESDLEAGTAVIEMASLYQMGVESPPEPNGALVGIRVYGPMGETVCIDVALEPIREGVVMEDLTQPAVDQNEICLTMPIIIPCCCGDLTQQQREVWYGWEEPPVWCLPCWTLGDVTGDELLTFGDVIQTFNAVVDQVEAGDPNGSSDATMDGLYTFGDVIKVFNAVSDPCVVCP
ncbi:MAG: hypothetical protein ACYSUK_02760 [Planctomycetota bacterium]|jgi:hypothetical protein